MVFRVVGVRWLWLVLLLPLAPPAEGLPPVEGAGDPFFGANFVDPVEPWMTLAWDAGVRTVRTQLSWRDVELDQDVWTWEDMDSRIDPLVERGFDVLAILTLPAPWAQEHPDPEHGLMPRNLGLPWNHPENYWGRFVYNTAIHYRGRIRFYEIWNEPDLNMYWEGTPEEYYQLLRIAYRAIQAADPDATVLMAGMALLIEPDFFPTVVRLAAEDPSGPNFDVISLHMYSDPELVYGQTRAARELLDSYGLSGRPIWITETNVPLWGEGAGPPAPTTGFATPQEAGWYAIQAFANGLAAGAERVMIFRLADERIPVPYGMMRNSGEPRPAYFAFQTAATVLDHVVEASRDVTDDAITIRATRADGSHVTVMWAQAGQSIDLSVAAQSQVAVFVDAQGERRLVEPQGGSYTVNLLPATNRNSHQPDIYIIGGPPVFLVEGDYLPPTATIEEAIVQDESVLVRWQGEDGPLGTGVVTYDVEVSRNGGEWAIWLQSTAQTEGLFDASSGGRFAFRVRATDYVGNVGEYPPEPQAEVDLGSTLVAQVLNVRGEGVESASVELADGSLYHAGPGGWVRIEGLLPGPLESPFVDGGPQGTLTDLPPIELELGQEMVVTWVLTPVDDLILNGDFEEGLTGWSWSGNSQSDIRVVQVGETSVVQLAGVRRPWGSPAISVTLDLSQEMTFATLSFHYRLMQSGQALRVRVVTSTEQDVLWQTAEFAPEWEHLWLDMSDYAGQEITLIFELWGPKGTISGAAQLDSISLGNVPPLD